MSDSLKDTGFLLSMLMKDITDNVYFKDAQSRFIQVNEACAAWNGLTTDEMVGKTDFDLFSKEHAQPAYEDEQRILASGEPLVNVEEKETRPDGSITWVSSTKMPIRNPAGEIIGTFGISRDITAHKKLEQSLDDARKKAEQAVQAKSRFLANMSHEIRTPLNAMVGMSSLLADTELATGQRDFVDTIITSSEALLDIVNDILDLSKIEAGKLELESSPFNLIQAVEKTVDMIAPKALETGLEVMQYFSGSVPQTVVGDASRLRQVLLNLLSNAVKFTPQGEILVEVEGQPVDDGDYKITFLVSDTGIGMTPEEATRIFQPFEQADSSTTRKFGGTGLGLSICNKLVEMMGGGMTVQSEVGSGSKFKFFIIARQANDSVLPDVPFDPAILRNRRVLIVDDNETNLKILKHEVSQAGMQPMIFSSGPEALNALPSLEAFDIAVLDYIMPGMDGCSLSEKLRESEHFGSRPILILSSSGRPSSGSAHVVNRWLSKPVKERRLHEALASLLGGTSRPTATASKEMTETGRMAETFPHRILLVEDNKVNQKVTLKMLEKMGYDVDLAEDGRQAVDAVLANEYDMVLMDIQMPVMDGLEATRLLCEKLGDVQRPRIIGLSAHALKENREEAFAMGMNDYLSKPLKFEDLLEALKFTNSRSIDSEVQECELLI